MKVIISLDQFNQMATSGLAPWQSTFEHSDLSEAQLIKTAKGNDAIQIGDDKVAMNALVQTLGKEDSIFIPIMEGTGRNKTQSGYEFSLEGLAALSLLKRTESGLSYQA
jgi:hypothetical protein